MQDWPQELRLERFAPREVEKLNGVSTDQQRLWSSRYGFDYRIGEECESPHRRWTWEGIQRLTIFADVFADLKDADTALLLSGISGMQLQPGPTAARSLRIELTHDLRDHEEDLFLYKEFGGSAAEGLTTLKGLLVLEHQFVDLHRPRRSYLYNISAMQRRLWAARFPVLPS